MHKGFKFAAMLNYQRIFVTGATGFVGAHTLYYLLQNGFLLKKLRIHRETRNQFATDLINNFTSGNPKEKEEAIEALEILKIEKKVFMPDHVTLKKDAKQVIADSLLTGKNFDFFVEGITKATKLDEIPSLK